MEWNDDHTTLFCKLFAEQVRKGNRLSTHLNNGGYTEVNDRFFQCTRIMLKKMSTEEQVGQVKG
jgi:hypothetical protein